MGEWSYHNSVARSFHTKKLGSRLFVLHYDITLTSSRFTSPIARFRRSNIALYCIKTPLHTILSVRIVYKWLKTSQIIHLLVLTTSSEYFLILVGLAWLNVIGDFKGWVTLRLNFRLKGYISRQYVCPIRYRNGHTTTLPLQVFTQRNFVANFIQLKFWLIKNEKNTFWATLWGT